MTSPLLATLDAPNPAAPVRARLNWVLGSQCPPTWHDDVQALGGGFFHTPVGLATSGRPGEWRFARLYWDGHVVGVMACVRSSCRLSVRPAHYYLPTLPAVAARELRQPAFDALLEALSAAGAASVLLDSYHADWQVLAPRVRPAEVVPRREFVLPLGRPTDMRARLAQGHRRQVARGDRSGCRVETMSAQDAAPLLAAVQRAAADRATRRGNGFEPLRLPPAGLGEDPARAAHGSATFVALQGDVPLAAAMVGWAGGQAFYVAGGATLEGYRAGASIWLHWRIMCRLAAAGCVLYNLGGTPASAESSDDPGHGLYRFKAGFGSTVRTCVSTRWVLSPAHERFHRLGTWLGSALRR